MKKSFASIPSAQRRWLGGPSSAIWFMVFAILLAKQSAQASFIRLNLRAGAHITSSNVEVVVKTTNLGDEPAYAVSLSAGYGHHSAISFDKCERLDAGHEFIGRVQLDAPLAPPGVHTILIRIRYTDANGYPFSTLTSLPVVSAEPHPIQDPVTIALAAAPWAGRGEGLLTVASDLTSSIIARVTIALPDELASSKQSFSTLIPPREKQLFKFRISNVSGWPGSTYPVIAVVDYELNGIQRSVASVSTTRIKPSGFIDGTLRQTSAAIIIVLVCAFLLSQCRIIQRCGVGRAAVWEPPSVIRRGLTALFFLAMALFTLAHLAPDCLILDTTTVGGDTPAHNYLASQVAHQFFKKGRLTYWANGWWCGFPLFQFYFIPPYLTVAFLSQLVPFNLAFKWVTVAGILVAPAAAALGARLCGEKSPIPLLVGAGMLIVLFDSTNTMWGVNVFSTLAGMIANSWSFPLMLLSVASAARDAWENRFRVSTTALLALLAISHFFTIVIAAMTLCAVPFMNRRRQIIGGFIVLIAESGLALLLASWWLIPLATGTEFTVPFGDNWDLSLQSLAVRLVMYASPAIIIVGVLAAVFFRNRFLLLHAWMLLCSVVLFFFGWKISAIFVNIRLWPFVAYSSVTISAATIGNIISSYKRRELFVAAAAVSVIIAISPSAKVVAGWARWNYLGMERHPRWEVIRDLILPLDGTPGRLANDLCERNNSLGSTRIFEAIPHLIRKPIVEGGILTSSPGSLYAYYLQSETSQTCAGFPKIVTPATFNMTNATRHMELLNVKHFIACWAGARNALAQLPQWRKLGEREGWELFELQSNDGRYVVVPSKQPIAVVVSDWKKAGLEWFGRINALDQPFVFLKRNSPPDARFQKVLNETEYRQLLDILEGQSDHSATSQMIDAPTNTVESEQISDGHILFRTRGLGLPHLIKINYHPNWKVRGASRIYLSTPCFMIVYPDQEEVELYYGFSSADIFGMILTTMGVAILTCLIFIKPLRLFLTQHCDIAKRTLINESHP